MRQIHPEPADDPDLPSVYAYPQAEWLRLNMVASADGGAWLKGLSKGLSSPGDRRIFMVLRGLADVVVAGGATVRIEGYGPSKPRDTWRPLRAGRSAAPPVAVITRKIDLDLGGALFTECAPESRTIVITTESAPADRRAEAARHADVIVAGEQRVDLAEAVAELRSRGLGRILCEGGPRLNAHLAAASLVDELCLTVSPLMIGGDAARVLNGTASHTRFALAGVLEEEGSLFCRYVRDPHQEEAR
uniref:pyrimidine reductase family protein n=1 Tax=Herbidospora sakaeratensis TaxID=564415 RepID=UPI000780ADAF|nr:pyrimidine reductase family protein [Herbidospora sakaeratensis]